MSKLQNERRAWESGTPLEEEASFRVVDPNAAPNSRAQVRAEHLLGSPARVLLVDDDPVILRSLVRMLKLQRPNFELTAVLNATSAIEELRKQRFDVLVTDLQMPEVRGEELLEVALNMDPTLTCVVHSNQVLCMPSELRARLRATINKPATATEICATLDDAVRRAEHVRESLHWM